MSNFYKKLAETTKSSRVLDYLVKDRFVNDDNPVFTYSLPVNRIGYSVSFYYSIPVLYAIDNINISNGTLEYIISNDEFDSFYKERAESIIDARRRR